MDFADARKWMVDGQVRPNKVTDPRIIDAMLELPRHLFVPEASQARAHADKDVPLGDGRVLMQPMMLARLVQTAQVRSGDSVLVLGAGSGYGAALLARLGGRVTALENNPALLVLARNALAGSASLAPGSVRVLAGRPADGMDSGTYDVVFIEGEVPAVPKAISDQLAEGGRLVAICRRPGRSGTAVLGRRAGGNFSMTETFDCNTAPLPSFVPEPAFVL